MRNLFKITLQNRRNLHGILDDLSRDKLLKIPEGYRNNIWWNIAHIVVTQQLLLYKLSGLQVRIPDELINEYRKGTVPDGTAPDEEIKMVSGYLVPTIEWAQEDYNAGLFENYNEYTTSAKVTLKNIEDAIAFNLFHEGLHLGAIVSLKKILMG
ncbi:DinB family protein [Costertonia aggregata]|uniref:DinB family protein n=1 Tax=Costertonia aggregata TaxID=343403 RepID=A0A7H9AQ34_9FLAO|nr:DinB family protein [Costertonia aggregata]QLG45546.1 DinB family protein [Costertonia aggregata]